MIQIVTEKEFSVPFKVFQIGTAQEKIVCLSENGQFAVFDPKSDELRFFLFDVVNPLRSAAIFPSTGTVACVAGVGLIRLNPFNYEWKYGGGRFDSCSFGRDGVLWTAKRTDEVVLIEKRTSADNAIAAIEIDDLYPGPILLNAHPISGCAVYISGGQDGQALIWIAENGEELVPSDSIDTEQLDFDFDAKRLVTADIEGITLFSLEDFEEIDSVSWEELGVDEDFSVLNLTLLSHRFGLLRLWDNDRLCLLDLEANELINEVPEIKGVTRRLVGHSTYSFCSVERLEVESPSISLGSMVRLWNWKDSFVS